MSRTGQFIYLKTRGCLEVDDKTRQVHSFVCVNSLVSDDEGRRLIREMKKKFSAIISEEELSAMESDVPAVENPQKLERAILNLITNLNNATSYDDDSVSIISDSTAEHDDNRRIKSPPLAIIPPKPNTIKPSIFKAVSVIDQATKGKSPSVKDEPKSPETPATSHTSHELNIKVESTNVILSPTSSSMSSIDSDASSPFLSSNSHHVASTTNTSSERNYSSSRQSTSSTSANNSVKLDDFFAPYENLPISGIDAISSDSMLITSSNVNNNNSNNNRNSVLKRVYTSDENDDDYTEVVKKRVLSLNEDLSSSVENPSLDLLNMTASGSGKAGSDKFTNSFLHFALQISQTFYHRRFPRSAWQSNFITKRCQHRRDSATN